MLSISLLWAHREGVGRKVVESMIVAKTSGKFWLISLAFGILAAGSGRYRLPSTGGR